jgi:hypothetical protein
MGKFLWFGQWYTSIIYNVQFIYGKEIPNMDFMNDSMEYNNDIYKII